MKTKGAKRGAFYVRPFIYRKSKTRGWRVIGTKINGERVREKFNDELKAEARRQELVSHIA